MLSPKIILIALVAFLLLGLTLLAFQYWIVGGIITAIGGALLYLWWRMNQIVDVSNSLAKNDLEGARKKLDSVKNPDKLNPYSKTYHFFLRGMVDIQQNRFKEAKQAFKTSLDTNRFRSVDEKATALVMMAQLDLRTRNLEGAKRYLREAKSLEPGDEVRQQINTIIRQARLRGV